MIDDGGWAAEEKKRGCIDASGTDDGALSLRRVGRQSSTTTFLSMQISIARPSGSGSATGGLGVASVLVDRMFFS